jgi:hypothetical protein
MNKYIKMGFSIKDDGIFEFNYAPLSLEDRLKEKGFEVVYKQIYVESGYCTIRVKMKQDSDIRILLDLLRERNEQVIEDYKKERGLTW